MQLDLTDWIENPYNVGWDNFFKNSNENITLIIFTGGRFVIIGIIDGI